MPVQRPVGGPSGSFAAPGARPLVAREGTQGLVRMPDAGATAPYKDFAPSGLRRGAKVIVVTSPKGGTGKALDLNEVVITPRGWRRFGDLVVGDEVFDERGAPCHVVALSQVWSQRESYRLTLSDTSTVVADGAHEWPIYDDVTDSTVLRTTSEIALSLSLTESLVHGSHPIIGPSPLEWPETTLDLDPFVLGAWLGDDTATSDAIVISASAQAGDRLVRSWSGAGVSAEGDEWVVHLPHLSTWLEHAGVTTDKSIPADYLWSSPAQRRALLEGLLATGSTRTEDSSVWSSQHVQLRTDVADLARSLGHTVVELGTTLYISPTSRTRPRHVVSCERVAARDTRCIEVDSPSHLFLAGRGMVPTHNSTLTLNMAAYMALRVRPYNKRVCIIDANFQQADAGKMLGQYSPNITNIIKDPASIAPNAIERYLVRRDDLNMSVLLGPAMPEEANPAYLNSRLYSQVLEALRPNFDYIFIDTPVAEVYHDLFKGFVLPSADYIILPLTPALHTIMNVDAWLTTVTLPRHAGGDDVDPNKVGIVLNQAEDGVDIGEAEIQRELSRWHFIGSVPRSRAWINALNNYEIVSTKNYHELNDSLSRILYYATGDEALLVGVDQSAHDGSGGRDGLVGRLREGLVGGLLGRISRRG